MDLCIIGSGYVGLVSGACFAEIGHHVVCVDNDQRKVDALQSGKIPIYEPGLEELVHRNVAANRLRFTNSIQDGVDHSQIIFIAVPTPPQTDGSVDLTYIERVAREIAGVLQPGHYRVVVDKSTVPVKTGEKVAETIKRYNKGAEFDVVSNPEFLREGSAVPDLMNPDRIVIGSASQRATDLMKQGLVTDTIATRDAIALARKDETADKPIPISEIGQRVGADTIIYVQIENFALSAPGGMARPSAQATVKVIDVSGRSRLYPAPSELKGQPVATSMREVSEDLYQSTAGRRQIEDILAAEIGAEVAKLFYKHEVTELGKNLGIRK